MTKLNDQLLDFLIREGCGAVSIIKHEEDEWFLCPDGTCDWSEYEVDITFVDTEGNHQIYTYRGSLSDLIRKLNPPAIIPNAAPIYYERIQ